MTSHVNDFQPQRKKDMVKKPAGPALSSGQEKHNYNLRNGVHETRSYLDPAILAKLPRTSTPSKVQADFNRKLHADRHSSYSTETRRSMMIDSEITVNDTYKITVICCRNVANQAVSLMHKPSMLVGIIVGIFVTSCWNIITGLNQKSC
jgi:hypothetical protein